METCERCGAELGVGRFCLNCGHPVDEPVDHDDDFLPWLREDDADDLDDVIHDEEDESSASPWLAWVGGLAGCAVLAVVLASCLGGDGDDAPVAEQTPSSSAEPEASEPEPSTAATPQGEPVSLSDQATATAPITGPPTQDLDGEMVAYDAPQMLDGLPETAWRMPGAGGPGGASGAVTLTFDLASPTEITRVGLINGYAKQVEGVDWYPNNRRITAATWTFDDGTTVAQTFTEEPTMQSMQVPAVVTSSIRLTIDAVTLPGGGTLGRDYTAISEVELMGRPAS